MITTGMAEVMIGFGSFILALIMTVIAIVSLKQ
ncbi:putative holin-like toxin [Alteribacillus sp. JSM 102045]